MINEKDDVTKKDDNFEDRTTEEALQEEPISNEDPDINQGKREPNPLTNYIVLGVVVVLLVALITGTLVFQDGNNVVAIVNDEEIYEEDLEGVLEQEKQRYMLQGVDLESEEMTEMLDELREEALDRLITITLLKQIVEDKDIKPDEDEFDAYYRQYVEMYGGEDQLEEQLLMMGTSLAELKEDLALGMAIELYFNQYVEEQEAKEEDAFSEEELKELFQEFEGQIEEDFDDVRPELEMMMYEQKLIEDLKAEADIEIKL